MECAPSLVRTGSHLLPCTGPDACREGVQTVWVSGSGPSKAPDDRSMRAGQGLGDICDPSLTL